MTGQPLRTPSFRAGRCACVVVLLLSVPAALPAQDFGEFQMVLDVDARSAEKTIELYQGLSGRPDDIAQLRGSQIAVATTAMLSQRRLETADLERALGAAKFNQSLGDDPFRMKEARQNVAGIKELFLELQRRNFAQKVIGTVEQLFPAGAKIRARIPIYIVAFGHQNIDAFVRRVVWRGNTPVFVGEGGGEGELSIVVNLAKAVYYGHSVDERFIGLLSVVAHEVFHAAFGAYKDQSPAWRAYYAEHDSYFDHLLDLAHNEGIAYYLTLVQSSRGRLPADWQERISGAFGTFNASAAELLSPAVSPRRAFDILRSANMSGYWENFGAITGMIIARQIDQTLGRNALRETIATGPVNFFLTYAGLMERDNSLPAISPLVLKELSRRR
jgi:Putative zinc dependent peptidase (DUF5700)